MLRLVLNTFLSLFISFPIFSKGPHSDNMKKMNSECRESFQSCLAEKNKKRSECKKIKKECLKEGKEELLEHKMEDGSKGDLSAEKKAKILSSLNEKIENKKSRAEEINKEILDLEKKKNELEALPVPSLPEEKK